MKVLAAIAMILALSSADDSSEDNNRDLWRGMERNVAGQLNRLQKLTQPHNCAASCHFSVHLDLVDYETAKKNCEEAKYIGFPTPGGRRLMSVHSELENRLAWYAFRYAYNDVPLKGKRYEEATNWAWIGLEKKTNTETRPNGSGKVVWNPNDWQWVDGVKMTPSSYTNWLTKHDEEVQPDMRPVEGAHQTAARIYRRPSRGGVWDDTFKNKLHPYICQFNLPVHYVVYPELKTWQEAKTSCEERGFYFAKIRNIVENDLFKKAVQVAYGEDRYEKKFHHENWIWIGATDLDESGTFKFYDGEEIKFRIPWAKKQHDNKTTRKRGSQDYVAVSRWGEWDDSYGLHWKRPFACQCSPQGIALDREMEKINEEWENREKIKEAEKERKRKEKEANREERKKKKAERKARKEQRQKDRAAKKEDRKQAKKDRKEQKAAKKEAKAEKKQAKKDAKEAKKEAKAAKKDAKTEKKAAKKEAKAEKKQAKKDAKEAKKEVKAAKTEKKAAKKEAKAAKKEARQQNKGKRSEISSVEKRQWTSGIGEELEKRQWPTIGEELEKRQWPEAINGEELEKRQWPDGVNGEELEKRQWPDGVNGEELEKRQWSLGVKGEQLRKRQWPQFD